MKHRPSWTTWGWHKKGRGWHTEMERKLQTESFVFWKTFATCCRFFHLKRWWNRREEWKAAGHLGNEKAEVRPNINSLGLRLREGKIKWEGMLIEVETNGTRSEVDVNLFLSSTFCLLTLYPHMTVAKHSKLSSGLIQIEHPPIESGHS